MLLGSDELCRAASSNGGDLQSGRGTEADFHNRAAKIKFIVSDMDGTLLGKDHLVSADNIRAVQALRAKGIRFTIATGRVDYMVSEFARQLDITEPVISCNGALVRSLLNKEVLVKNLIKPNSAREILKFFNALDFDILAYEKDRICHPRNSVRIDFFRHYNEIAKAGGSEEIVLQAFDRVEDTFYEDQEFLKLFIWQPDASKLKAASEHLAMRYPDLYFVQSTAGSLDITAKGTTKGTAVLALAKHYGYAPDEVAVFGDQNNDVAMFEVAGLAFAMENASPKALAAADLVLGHHDQGGFSEGIKRYFLD